MGSECEQSKLFYVLAQLLSASIREFFAVALFIILTLRADGYDFFNTGIVLFLVLIVVRLPFLNSYAFIFEATTIKSWDIKHVGVQKHNNWGYNTMHAVAILVTHVLAGIAAAAFKVYYEVAYGKERMGALPIITPELVVDTDVLRKMGTDWSANERLSRLHFPLSSSNINNHHQINNNNNDPPFSNILGGEMLNANSTTSGFLGDLLRAAMNSVPPSAASSNDINKLVIPLPLNSTVTEAGIDKTALLLWYFCEDAAYVTLLCICFVHIWIGTGVVKEKDDAKAAVPLNPFRPRYWQQLFRISLLLTMIQLALSRAFPTAHGSLHTTVYKLQYQSWTPDSHLVDNENGEAAIRIIGGLIGVVLGKIYSWTLLSTKLDRDDTWYFSLVWGMESPFEAEKELARQRRQQNYYAALSSTAGGDEEDPAATSLGGGYNNNNGEGGGDSGSGLTARRQENFKLRLPYTLNHNK
jgi:hypothetical protein